MVDSLQTEQCRHGYSCIYLSMPLCWIKTFRCNASPIVFLCVHPDRGWQRSVECWMFAVCCYILTRCFAMYPLFLHKSISAGNCLTLGLSLLSSQISSPRGISKADEGVSGCSLQLCCSFLVTSTFFIYPSLFLSFCLFKDKVRLILLILHTQRPWK